MGAAAEAARDQRFPQYRNWTACVYLYRDSEGRVLYIGQTACMQKRRREHAGNSEWWPLVAAEEIVRIDSESIRREVEAELLGSFQPPFNVQGTERGRGVRRLAREKTERHGRRHYNGWPCDCFSCTRNYDHQLAKGRLSPLQVAAGKPPYIGAWT